MSITTVTSRELNQNLARAKRASRSGPVHITDRGRPAHVLLSYSDYQKLVGGGRKLTDALSMPGLADLNLDTAKLQIERQDVGFDE